MMVPDFSGLASLLADSGRARMLSYLMNNGVATASELSRSAGLSAQATSNHLSKLVYGKIVRCEKQGRFRYYMIFDDLTAHIIETLIVGAYGQHLERTTFHKKGVESLCLARTCYDHMAGKLGVSVLNALVNKDYLFRNNNVIEITNNGKRWIEEVMRINYNVLSNQRRGRVLLCMDWSERSHHISGALGAEMYNIFLERNYVRKNNESRSLCVTQQGKMFLKKEFNLDFY